MQGDLSRMQRLGALDFDNPETCPNCGQFVGGDSTCPNCGAILGEDDEYDLFDDDGELE